METSEYFCVMSKFEVMLKYEVRSKEIKWSVGISDYICVMHKYEEGDPVDYF